MPEGSQGRSPQAGAGGMLFIGSLSLLSCTTQDHWGSVAPSELGSPTSIINKKIPSSLAHKLSDGGIFSSEIPRFR